MSSGQWNGNSFMSVRGPSLTWPWSFPFQVLLGGSSTAMYASPLGEYLASARKRLERCPVLFSGCPSTNRVETQEKTRAFQSKQETQTQKHQQNWTSSSQQAKQLLVTLEWFTLEQMCAMMVCPGASHRGPLCSLEGEWAPTVAVIWW